MRRSFYIRTHRAPFHKISKYEQRMSNCKQVHDLAKISAQPSPALPGRHRLHPCCVLLACAEAWRPAGAEGSRCCELESVTSITSVQSEPYTAHTAGPPPLPRGVNSRSQISRSARLIHHPFRAFVHSLSPSFRPAQSFWILAELTTQ